MDMREASRKAHKRDMLFGLPGASFSCTPTSTGEATEFAPFFSHGNGGRVAGAELPLVLRPSAVPGVNGAPETGCRMGDALPLGRLDTVIVNIYSSSFRSRGGGKINRPNSHTLLRDLLRRFDFNSR